MQQNPNPNPAPEQARDGARIIEDLKAAGEELKMSPPKTPRVTPSETTTRPPHPPTPRFARSGPLIDLPKKIEEYQKEISQEQSALEKTYQQVKELEKRLGERIEFLKGLQTKGIEINKGLREFQEQLALAKKENSSLLNEIKNKLGREL